MPINDEKWGQRLIALVRISQAKNEIDESLNLIHPTRTGDIVIFTESPNMLVSRKNSNPSERKSIMWYYHFDYI